MMEKKQTERQKKLIKLISENLGNRNSTMSMYEMMLKANYTDKTAKQQSEILNGIRDDLKPVVDQLEVERQNAINSLKGQLDKAKYRDLIDGIDKLTKNIQLLKNKPTEITKYTLSKAEQEKIDSLLDN